MGQWVGEGGPVAELVDMDPMVVRVPVPERYVRFVEPGKEAALRFPGTAEGEEFSGTVRAVIPQGDRRSRTFPVEVAVPNPEGSVLAGMACEVEFPAARAEERLLVPKDALVLGSGGAVVFVVKELTHAPQGGLVPLNSVSSLELVAGPSRIKHLEQQRAIVVRIIPPSEISMERAMAEVQGGILEPMRGRRDLGTAYDVRLTGTADDLTRTREALAWNFVLAVVITYLLMAALFENFFYPLVIRFSVPLAAAGGFVGLWAVNCFLAEQPMDILTMLGFVILVGIVVNNAILIVHQSLGFIRQSGLDAAAAVREAVRIRVRPIFMSTATSALGMSPLVFFPGAGSELYRGLGSVVIGAFVLSAVFTLVLIPALFTLVHSLGRFIQGLFRREAGSNAS